MRGAWRRALALLAVLLPAACATAPVPNAPLASPAANRGYDLLDANLRGGRADLLVLLSFSGGGKRSSAFAHGALRAMRALPMPGGAGRLLDEVDQIAAVSGGSFTAAHLALHGEAHFTRFGPDFLDRDIEAYLWGSHLLPWTWSAPWAAPRGSNDRMAEVYDRHLFGGATFATLMRQGRPRLVIGATDLATGINIAFLPQPFDLICSDLARYPLARAVAASNGFPVLLSPITLVNHRRGDCPAPPPPLPEPAAIAADQRQRQLAGVMRRYMDGEATPYLHLLDGGASDNLALRYVLNTLAAGGERGEDHVARRLRLRRVLMLVVDGQAAADGRLSRQPRVSGLATVISAVSGGQIDNYNLETLALAEAELERFVAGQVAQRCARAPRIEGRPCADVAARLLRVSLDALPDPVARARLLAVPTGLTLPADDVAALVAAGEALPGAEPGLGAFLAGLDVPAGR